MTKPPMDPRPPKKHSTAKSQHTTNQHEAQTPAFRQKVVSANKTTICTTTSQLVGRRTLRRLLHPEAHTNNNSAPEAYIVPIFQRRYCWTTPQWDTLWDDILKQKHIKHSLGRLTCTNVGTNCGRSIIIDGQQRFTTVTLILAAIRDSLVSPGINAREDDALLRSIDQMLFLDPCAMEQWVVGNGTAISEGMALEFCRLVPTFCDRSAYLAAILPPSAPQITIFLAEKFNPKWHRSLLAKRYFADKIQSLLVSLRTSEEAHEALEGLTRSLLDGIDMLYFPIDIDRGYDDGTEDTQVIYERLAVRDATWCKPSRTSEYHSMDGTDMIRNLFLGSFSTSKQKTEFYETVWLPLERMFQTTGVGSGDAGDDEESLKAVFRAFLDDQTTKEEALSLSTATKVSPSVIGGLIYHDFQNWMAHDFEGWKTTYREFSSPTSSPAEEHTQDVGARLLEFATEYKDQQTMK